MTNGEPLRVTTPTDTEIVLTRVFAAPRRLVFDAWTKPELLTRWFGARGWHLTVCEVDLRVGGAWRFVSRGPDGTDLGQGGVYREIVPPDRLVYTESFDAFPGETLVTNVFVEHDGTTTLTSAVLYPSREVRDMVLRSPMERGAAESYDRLANLLANLHGRRVMSWTLDIVVIPVSNVDCAKAFYVEKLGFTVDHDTKISEGNRIVRLTPPGSGCSIVVGEGVVPNMQPGTLKGVQLAVSDIHQARAQLIAQGVDVSEVKILSGNTNPRGDTLDNVGFVVFADPDGNAWVVQQTPNRD